MKHKMTFIDKETTFIDEEAYFSEHLQRYISQSSTYLLKGLHNLCQLSYHEILIRSGISTSGIWNAEQGRGICTIATFAKLLYCYLHAQSYLFRPHHLVRQMIEGIRSGKHIVVILVDDQELENYSNRQKLLINRLKNDKM